MRIAVIADEDCRDLAQELADDRNDARVIAAPEGLAASLVAFERDLSADPPELVVLIGAGDIALAGALVATKLGIPVSRVEAGGKSDGEIAHILSILAPDSYTDSR